MHLSDTSSIAQHLKKHSCPTTQLRKILTDNTTILENQNNKKNYRFSKHYLLKTCNRHLIELIFKSVLMYLNVLATDTNYRNPFKSKRHNLQRQRRSYIVVIC